MRAIAAGVTDVGRERAHNEDRFVLLPEFSVFVVADGMGGHQCGEVASRMATATIAEHFRERGNEGRGVLVDVLRGAVHAANDRIHARAASSALHHGMGTTLVAAAFHRDERMLYVAHAGDSRCYCLRRGELRQLTRDHSLIEEALRARPEIGENELAYLPANVITRALGVDAVVDVELTIEACEEGDVYLLCSDGLHGFVTDERIEEILMLSANLAEVCTELVAEANRQGGGDNITAVVVRMEPTDEPWSAPSSPPSHATIPSLTGPHLALDGASDPDATMQITGTQNNDTERAALRHRKERSKKRRGGRRRRKKRAVVAPAADAAAGAARAKLEADDTAQLEPVTDPDEVLKRSR
ncbi:MAG TPA: Stp1/IreP family PP2C-type Ser/Thr phosphatase [Sorangium sp.]|nr:Stp1/IreP family PP2C-type Ser/Thr phosphatase [Sorangium sp.]